MKSKQKIKKIFLGIIVFYLLLALGFLLFLNKKQLPKTMSPVFKPANAKILSDGMVRSQNEVNLHFGLGGKLVYMPFKEGDQVWKGQTVASLDTYALQKQLNLALNNYRATRDSFDQLQDNNQNNYLTAQQANPFPLNYFNLSGIGGNDKANAVNDMIKRLIDQSQAGLDNSVIQVELANYAFTLSSISAPFNGIITHLDVTTPNVMVSPATSFTIEDPDAMVFRANVSENDINFIQEGSLASIQLAGVKDQTFSGVIIKIYPDKITLPTGENVYQVDIDSEDLKSVAKFKQDGTVLINSKYDHQVVLVPSWMLLSKKYIWIMHNNKPQLKEVAVGDTVGEMTEVTSGLQPTDKLITNPASIAGSRYFIL